MTKAQAAQAAFIADVVARAMREAGIGGKASPIAFTTAPAPTTRKRTTKRARKSESKYIYAPPVAGETRAERKARNKAEFAQAQAQRRAERQASWETFTALTVRLHAACESKHCATRHAGSVEVGFPSKPAPEVLTRMKALGFAFAVTRGIWYTAGVPTAEQKAFLQLLRASK